MRLTPGLRLGPYEVLAVLGSGGMAEVYRARDTRLGREIAIKVVNESLASHPELLQRFEQEARLAGSLNHPNLVAVHDVGQHDGSPFLVTELLAGETLRRRLARGPIPLDTALEWAAQIALGLAAAHARGIVHRDLKPDNVFLTTDGHVKLLDFGIAKLVEGVRGDGHHGLLDATETPTGGFTRTGSTFGTPGYMSPEQVRGETLDARSDLFSLGAVLYEMLSGRRAFPGGSVDSNYAILHNEPTDLSSGVPLVVAQVVNRCLAKEPTRRFQSASDLAFDLQVLRSPASTSSPVSGTKARDTAVRLKARWIPVGAALLLLVGAGIGALVPRARNRPVALPLELERVTFRLGSVDASRFMPDGRVAFSASFEGDPEDVFIRPSGSVVAQPLGLRNAHLAAVSRTGELAVLLDASFFPWGHRRGTLARLPAIGAAPREVAENVTYADWSPGGELAAVVERPPSSTLEFPVGNVLFRTTGNIADPRFSSRGDRIAFIHHPQRGDSVGELMLVNLRGETRSLGQRSNWAFGLAWAPGDVEIWHTVRRQQGQNVLLATTPDGTTREVYRSISGIRLGDLAPDGSALLSTVSGRRDMIFLETEQSSPRVLTWGAWSDPIAISADGRILFLAESTGSLVDGVEQVLAIVRRTDGTAPRILGELAPSDISRDGRRALVFRGKELLVVPTGPGPSLQVDTQGLEVTPFPGTARWLGEGEDFLVFARRPGEAQFGFYVLKDHGSAPRRVSEAPVATPPAVSVSHDGKWLATRDPEHRPMLISLTDGKVVPLPQIETHPQPRKPLPRGWAPDGSLWVQLDLDQSRAEMARVDVRNGKVLQRQVLDIAGGRAVRSILPAFDGRGFVFASVSERDSLYIAKGLEGSAR